MTWRERFAVARMAGGREHVDQVEWEGDIKSALKCAEQFQRPFPLTDEEVPRNVHWQHVMCTPDQVPVKYTHLLSAESTLAQLEGVLDYLDDIAVDLDDRQLAPAIAKLRLDHARGRMRYLLGLK